MVHTIQEEIEGKAAQSGAKEEDEIAFKMEQLKQQEAERVQELKLELKGLDAKKLKQLKKRDKFVAEYETKQDDVETRVKNEILAISRHKEHKIGTLNGQLSDQSKQQLLHAIQRLREERDRTAQAIERAETQLTSSKKQRTDLEGEAKATEQHLVEQHARADNLTRAALN